MRKRGEGGGYVHLDSLQAALAWTLQEMKAMKAMKAMKEGRLTSFDALSTAMFSVFAPRRVQRSSGLERVPPIRR